MSKYLGDYGAGDVIDFKFTTFRPSTGAPFTLAGTPVVSVYKDNSTTESTAGVTLTVDFDARTGMHHVNITTLSDATFYADGSSFECVITAGTVDSVSVVGSCIGRFTLRDQACLYPTVAGRKLDVTTTGEAGIDWANIGSPTTTVALTGTTVSTSQVVGSLGATAKTDVENSVWNASISSHTTNGTYGLRIVRSDTDTKNGDVTMYSTSGGGGTTNGIDVDIHRIANDATAATNLKSMLMNTSTITLGAQFNATGNNAVADGLLTRRLAMTGNIGDVSVTSISSATFTGNNTYVAGDAVQFIGTAPASFTVGTKYYVISTSLTSTTFQLSATLGGSAITTASTGAYTVYPIDDRTMRAALRYLRNKVAISGSTMTVSLEDDATAGWTAALTTSPGVDPVTTFDPA